MTTTVSDCIRHEPILDFYNTAHLMQERYGKLNIDDDMMAMWPDWAADHQHNDSYWHLYRDWIPTKSGKTLWDLICLELGLDQTVPYFHIVFWVSW